MRGLILAVLSSVLFACAGHAPAPVTERYQDSEQSPDSYRVNKGDTLFSVAFRYGKTVEQLSYYNKIKPPYTIFVGQKLVLNGPDKIPHTVTKKSTTKSAAKPKPVSKPLKKIKKPLLKPDDGSWYWPLASSAKISNKFVAGSSNKGIDLVAAAGSNVLAARGGVVVYAGSGLPGYGNLLIIKHDAQYLSAYAHNQRLLVREGESVNAKQHVAELGSTATNSPKLHFEIRKDGRPVNPLLYIKHP